MNRAPGLGPATADVDRISERIEAGLDQIETGRDRARGAAEGRTAADARRERGLARLDAALDQLNELLGGSDGKA